MSTILEAMAEALFWVQWAMPVATENGWKSIEKNMQDFLSRAEQLKAKG